MRRPSVFVLLIAMLVLVGVAMAVVAAVDGSVVLVLAGLGLVLLGGAVYVADQRAQVAQTLLERRLRSGFDAVRQDLTDLAAAQGLATVQDLAEVTARLGRLDVRLDKAQRRLVASSEAARLDVAERETVVREAL